MGRKLHKSVGEVKSFRALLSSQFVRITFHFHKIILRESTDSQLKTNFKSKIGAVNIVIGATSSDLVCVLFD